MIGEGARDFSREKTLGGKTRYTGADLAGARPWLYLFIIYIYIFLLLHVHHLVLFLRLFFVSFFCMVCSVSSAFSSSSLYNLIIYIFLLFLSLIACVVRATWAAMAAALNIILSLSRARRVLYGK